jgi:hypothetical protein
MIVRVGDTSFTLAVEAENGSFVVQWRCEECQIAGTTAAASPEIALNGAKASLLIHHTMEHGVTFIGYV